MKNKILILILVLAIIISGYFYFQEEQVLRDPTTFADGQKLKLQGRVIEYYFGDNVFMLSDGEYKYQVLFDENISIEMGDFITVSGTWNMLDETLESEVVTILSEAEKASYLKSRYMIVGFDIKEYPQEITSGCETIKFEIDIENKSESILQHRDLYNEEFDYQVSIFINEIEIAANRFLDDYDQVFESENEEPMRDLGYYGVSKFADLQPNEKKTVEYWAGGKIIEFEDLEPFKIYNIFKDYEAGEYEITFGWVSVENNNFVNLYRSQPVTIKVVDSTCD